MMKLHFSRLLLVVKVTNTYINVQTADFNFGAEVDNLEAQNNTDGAIVTFIGRVRDNNDGFKVAHLTLEHYPGMTEKCLADIVLKAREQWTLGNVSVIHRVG
jgi:molybdopterin synthase catalytic subunit